MKHKFTLMLAAAFLAAGCQSHPKPKVTFERGWIGGDYQRAERKLVPKGEPCKIYLKRIYAGTPSEQAGLKPGDLIFNVNGHSVNGLHDFYAAVGSAPPGSEMTVGLYRDRQRMELPVVVGRERYQDWHSVVFGLGLSTHFDLWPNPDFSLLPVAQYRRGVERVELRSPEMTLARQAGHAGGKGETGTLSQEGWEAWFLVFGLNAHKQILAQEAIPR